MYALPVRRRRREQVGPQGIGYLNSTPLDVHSTTVNQDLDPGKAASPYSKDIAEGVDSEFWSAASS